MHRNQSMVRYSTGNKYEYSVSPYSVDDTINSAMGSTVLISKKSKTKLSQSTRLPRAKKGHQEGFLNALEEFLNAEEHEE